MHLSLKRTLISTIVLILVVCYFLRGDIGYINHLEDERQMHTTVFQKNNTSRKYDVVISGYMAGGTTLTGIILGYKNGSFYVYEPMWKISTWSYWQGFSSVCRTDRLICRNVGSRERTNDTDIFGNKRVSLQTAFQTLASIYDCKFNNFLKLVYIQHLTDGGSGPSWSKIKEYKGRGNRKRGIRAHLPSLCKQAAHRVTKTLRFSVDILGQLLSERADLKVIHLVRDPRAILNSRKETGWYGEQTKDVSFVEKATSLCNKMMYDFKEGEKLLKKFPDRFQFLYYEDLNENPFTKIENLYKFVGMDLDDQRFSHLQHLPVFSSKQNRSIRETNTAFWWRKNLSWDSVDMIQTACSDTLRELGYIEIQNRDLLENMSFKTLIIPERVKWKT